ncbi:MAG: hypothetical protein JNL43_12750 [Flavobacteriales bacterium]|nr:hypothetical protein [Flavobacteriales bacterium]
MIERHPIPRVWSDIMRRSLLLLIPLLMSTTAARAQCCCASISVALELPYPAKRDTAMSYTVSPGDGPGTSIHYSGDSLMHLGFRTGCGRSSMTWTIRHKWSGQEMRVDLEGLWGDVPYPIIRIPFTSGWYRFDLPELTRCQADQPGTDTIACHGGLMVQYREGRLTGGIRPLNILNFGWSLYAPLPEPTKAAPPQHPGGEAWFYRQLHTRFSKPLIERLNVRTTITGFAMVEESGYIHEVHLNGGIYPELDAELNRVMRLSQRWTPASVEDIAATSDRTIYRYIRQSIPISFNVDPDSIWTEVSEEALSILPLDPTSRDELTVTFHWTGGSCGQYDGYAKLQPAPKDGGPRDVFLYFGATLPAQCEDMQPQSFGFTMKALPPGRYRFRQMPHPKLAFGVWTPDPYRVRVVEVR